MQGGEVSSMFSDRGRGGWGAVLCFRPCGATARWTGDSGCFSVPPPPTPLRFRCLSQDRLRELEFSNPPTHSVFCHPRGPHGFCFFLFFHRRDHSLNKELGFQPPYTTLHTISLAMKKIYISKNALFYNGPSEISRF